jgi:tetratricopeptide (TPR) repeat protein
MDLRPGVLEGLKAWYLVQQGRIAEAINLTDDSWEQSAGGLAGLGFFHLLLEDYEKALGYYEVWEKLIKDGGIQDGTELRDWHRYGQVLVALGRKEEGQKMMRKQLELNEKLLVNYQNAHGVYYESAGIYVMLGKEKEALETLHKFDSINRWDDGKLHFIMQDPMFNNIRETEAFKVIINKRMDEIRSVREEVARLETAGAL